MIEAKSIDNLNVPSPCHISWRHLHLSLSLRLPLSGARLMVTVMVIIIRSHNVSKARRQHWPLALAAGSPAAGSPPVLPVDAPSRRERTGRLHDSTVPTLLERFLQWLQLAPGPAVCSPLALRLKSTSTKSARPGPVALACAEVASLRYAGVLLQSLM
jgi:hypothetical protein